jgi:hypothetical protein
MPRYFFNVVEGNFKNLVRDSEGTVFSSEHEARKEAVSFARDVVKHGFRESTRTWKVVVTDEFGTHVLTLPLSEIRAHKIRGAWFDLRHRFAKLESAFGPRTLAWLAAAAVTGIIVQAAVRTEPVTQEGRGYRTASAPIEGAFVAVRFAPQASAADIAKFLDAYNASLVDGPRPEGLYRLRIRGATVPQEELAEIVRRMAQEKVVEFAAAVR